MADLIDRQAAIDAFICEGSVFVYGRDTCKAIVSRLMQIPSAQPEQHWIPCSERLPDDVEIGEEYPTVIFCTSDGAVYVGGYEHYMGGKWWYMDTWEDEAKGVVAWMPLPEPWRGEEDD